MISKLTIQNFVLIDELDIRFAPGMNIITGETGAGKTILIGAFGLILGQRADSSMLSDKSKKCVIECDFEIGDLDIQEFFSKNDLDYNNTTTIRREINPEGKSRAFVNDTPVSLTILKDFGSRLVDIHSQHETVNLNSHAYQLKILDSFAQNGKLLSEYSLVYSDYQEKIKQFEQLTIQQSKALSDKDYFQFQFDELQTLNLKTDEQIQLEKELELLNNAESILTQIQKVQGLMDGETGVIIQSTEAGKLLSGISKFDTEISDLSGRLKSVLIELNDITASAEELAGKISFSPQRAEIIQARLDDIYRLEHKHHVNSVEELLNLRNQFETRLLAIGNLDEEINGLRSESEQLAKKLLAEANEISAKRSFVIPSLEKQIKELLKSVELPHAVFKIDLVKNEDGTFNRSGIDQIRFLFSANKGVEYVELQKAASGGELSRVMLCMKALTAKKMSLPTLIFDEIDTGVSGEVALRVAKLMNTISEKHQVVTITHLPQIASSGTDHFYVYKKVEGNKTFTRIRKLDEEGRVLEIAKMLSGENPSKTAIENAKELLER